MTMLSCPQILRAEDAAVERLKRLKQELYEKQAVKDLMLFEAYKDEYHYDMKQISKTGPWLIHVRIPWIAEELSEERLRDYLLIFKDIPELREVDIAVSSNYFTNEILTELCEISNIHRLLLSIYNQDADDHLFGYDLSPINKLMQLTKLELSGNFTNSDLVKINRRNDKMRGLSLYSKNIDGLFMEKYLTTFPNLESFELTNNVGEQHSSLSQQGLRAILSFPKLRSLDLSRAAFDIKLLDLFCEINHKHRVDIRIQIPYSKEFTEESVKQLAINAIIYRKQKFPNDPDVWFINNPFIYIINETELDKLKAL